MKSLLNSIRLPVTVVLALFISANLAHGQARLSDCYIVSAGIDNYPRANKLKGDVNDARNTTAAFSAQQGKIFGKVHAFTLVESQATRANILQRLHSFAKTGAAGDHVVVFLSGHGDSDKNTRVWTFLPWDFDPNNFAGTTITDKQILDAADANVKQGKKVFIIIDACFCGQVRNNAKPYFEKYQDPKGGGLVVMVSSSAEQMSNALGQYSAFAKAFADSSNTALSPRRLPTRWPAAPI